jgi:hypothetical protein
MLRKGKSTYNLQGDTVYSGAGREPESDARGGIEIRGGRSAGEARQRGSALVH